MIMDNRFLVARRRYDPDATRYINAVQLADGQALEPEVAMAVDAFVKGCKADGIWSAIKASCIMCGARTISGALVPLVGAAPTPYNFASGDYSRTTGLKGDGSTKYLTAGIGYNEIASSDEHLSVYASTAAGDPKNMIGGGTVSPASYSRIGYFIAQLEYRYDIQTGSDGVGRVNAASPTGFAGSSRSEAVSFAYRNGGATTEIANAAATRSTTATEYGVFCANYSDFPVAAPSNARLAFYSIGSALDLAALDNRVSTLVAAIAAVL